MTTFWGFVPTILLWAFIGALAVSCLFILWTWRYYPAMFGDGQYGMAFAVTFPVGWLIGAVIRSVIAVIGQNTAVPYYPLLTGIAVGVVGLVVLPIPGMLFINYACILIGWVEHRIKR